jgi:2-methylcitrate dehydratase
MQVRENERFTADYYQRDKRYIGNAVQVFFRDGTATERVQVDYPVGHRRRRAEGEPLMVRKFEDSVRAHFGAAQAQRIVACFADPAALAKMRVDELMSLLVRPNMTERK